ncbi:MAG: hypothetical protein AB7D36_02170 [Oscillospiraceae bacterium]
MKKAAPGIVKWQALYICLDAAVVVMIQIVHAFSFELLYKASV